MTETGDEYDQLVEESNSRLERFEIDGISYVTSSQHCVSCGIWQDGPHIHHSLLSGSGSSEKHRGQQVMFQLKGDIMTDCRNADSGSEVCTCAFSDENSALGASREGFLETFDVEWNPDLTF